MAGAQLQNTTKLDECGVRNYYRPDLECIVTGTVECRTRSHLGRTAFATDPDFVFALLQCDAHAPGVGQGRAAATIRPTIWDPYRHTNLVRVASLLRADMIFGKDRRMASIAADDALILPHCANPRGWNFRERQAGGRSGTRNWS